MKRQLQCLLAALSIAASPALATVAVESPSTKWTHELLAAAERPGEPFDDLLIARALRIVRDGGNAPGPAPSPEATATADAIERLERRAVANASGDWRALALLLTDPRGVAFDATSIADALLAAQADNGYAHMLLVAHAWRSESPERFVAAIARAPSATRWRSVVALAGEALRHRLGGEDLDTMVMATATAAAIAAPSYQDVVTPCRSATGVIAGQCLSLGLQMLRSGDSLIDIAIGTALVEALGSDAHKTEAAGRRKEIAALTEAALPRMVAMETDAGAFAAYLARSAEYGELGALRWLLSTNGQSAPPGVAPRPVGDDRNAAPSTLPR